MEHFEDRPSLKSPKLYVTIFDFPIKKLNLDKIKKFLHRGSQNLLLITQILSFFEKRTYYISKTMSRNDELNSRAEMIEDALQEGYAKGRDEGLAEGIIKGKEEGREEGREEGKATAILQNAKRMKELGIDVETIMKVTGLEHVTISNL